MGMNGGGFRNYYLQMTRNGSNNDLDEFFISWKAVYGWAFNDSTPWTSTDPKFKVPKVLSAVKTRMVSRGNTPATADKVIRHFKKWYTDTYPNG